MDYLFTNAQYGSQGVNLTGGGNGLGGGSGYYTPIVDNEQGQATGVRAEYYGVYLFSQAARGTLLQDGAGLGDTSRTGIAIEHRGAIDFLTSHGERSMATGHANRSGGCASDRIAG